MGSGLGSLGVTLRHPVHGAALHRVLRGVVLGEVTWRWLTLRDGGDLLARALRGGSTLSFLRCPDVRLLFAVPICILHVW